MSKANEAAAAVENIVKAKDPKKFKRAIKAAVKVMGPGVVEVKPTEKPTDAKPEAPAKRGRKPMAETMTKADISKEITQLLADLKEAKDLDEKKRIRRLLRRRGHMNGLGIRAAQVAKKAKKGAKKGKSAK